MDNKVHSTHKDNFFKQTLKVGNIESHSWQYCKDLCAGKAVLHIGCSDWPIFSKESNMHLYLAEFCRSLVGVDKKGTDVLKKHYKEGEYFTSTYEAFKHRENYDVILVPNVLEHVRNADRMVKELFEFDFEKMFVLVPNYKVYEQSSYDSEKGEFTEMVHPDHYSWYSPYTLYNLFKYQIESHDCEVELNFFDNQQMISLLITK